ncbi:hypothetical protein H7U19_07490 [Hyunsoonleella sp. SJ7]|uniref:Carboxypeptidase-like regulatory domain-containing protein n=1 Tax=Hyunsoonleella aquatilis TaxID=2762758 RepID=A0A923KGG3_9FLAO|nr:carboxypeptidase-like regulatory domain-containing protein [Hyunsoonleella aquatilis]MBC3758241.1 hypothetical protein [Hyunsoonleella aquatilis]
MKKLHYILIIISFGCTNTTFSQVSGKILMDSMALPGVTIKFKQSNEGVRSDFDGNFSLPFESRAKNDVLVISYIDLSLEIRNIDFNKGSINIGSFEMPSFKYISTENYEKLSDVEKENCHPTYCWGQLLGYYYTNKLEKEYLKLNCKEKITEFEFNPNTKTILVDWDLIKACK